MAQLTMSRRNFMKTMAITGAAAAVSSSAVAPMRALAEDANATAGELKHVRTCCRACGKVECGVWVTVQDGKAIKVEGDESAPQSRGHCCAKSQSSMHAAYHPDRLRYPVKRTNPKGSDDPGWVRITLDEAFELSGQGLGEVVDKYGGQSIFVMCGTSRVWSLGPYQGMKQLFGTPNAHLAYQVCKGPRHWAGIMTDEMGSPWMEVEAEPKVYLQWGTAVEYSNYDTTNRTISDVAPHATAHICVDPRVTPLSKEADIWLPLRPGTDGALALGWFNWIIENEAYDDTMVRRWSNAPFLFCDDKPWKTEGWLVEGNGGINMRTKLITEADIIEGGKYQRFMVWDENNNRLTYWDAEEGKWEGEMHKIPTTGSFIEHPLEGLVAPGWLPDPSVWCDPADAKFDAYWDEGNEKGKVTNPAGLPKKPALFPGEVAVTLKDGKTYQCRTVWDGFHDLTSQYTWDKVEEITGVPGEKAEEAVRVWTTRVDPRHGNGGIHFQLATDQNGNSIQNCRVLQMLSCVTGNSDEPAGNRGSCKSQFDGNPGRSNMQKAAPWGDAAKVWPGRDYSLEEVAKHMQDFVQYLIDENSPLAERYGNKVPSDEEAVVIAKRMGGAMLPSQGWPNPTTIFMRQAGQVDADRFPLNRFWARWADANCIWDACLQDPDWSLAMENENKEVGYNVKETLYALHGGVCQSGDIMNMGNIARAWDATTQLDFFVDINLWFCPNNGNADIILDGTRLHPRLPGLRRHVRLLLRGHRASGRDHLRSRLERGHVQGHGRAVEHEGPGRCAGREPQLRAAVPDLHRQVDRAAGRRLRRLRRVELPVARPRSRAEGQRGQVVHRRVPRRSHLGRGQAVVHRSRLDGLPRVASRALGHLPAPRDGLASSAGRLQPVPACGLPSRLHDRFRFGGDLVARVRGLHLQHGRGAGGLRQVGALRPAAVPGRRRPLPDLPRAHRLAGGEARAVRCRAR